MYRLRNLEPADVDAIARAFPDHAATVPMLGDAADGLHGVVVTDARARLCAVLAAERRECVTPARTLGVGIVRLATMRPELRIGGVHSLLVAIDEAFAERCEGPDRAFQVVVARWDEQDVWWFRRQRDYEPIAASIEFAGHVAPAVPPAGVRLTVVAAAAIDAAAVDLGAVMGLRRTGELLRRRAALPGRRTVVGQRDGRVVAWAIGRDRDEAVELEDVAVDWGDQPLTAALLAAVAGARPLRVTRWTDQEPEVAAWQAAGLRLAGPEHLLAARVSAFGLAPPTIAEFASFGALDVGAAPLPRLTLNERIVTPPPPGTRSTQGDHRRQRGNREQTSR